MLRHCSLGELAQPVDDVIELDQLDAVSLSEDLLLSVENNEKDASSLNDHLDSTEGNEDTSLHEVLSESRNMLCFNVDFAKSSAPRNFAKGMRRDLPSKRPRKKARCDSEDLRRAAQVAYT